MKEIKFVDTHCHLEDAEFDDDRSNIINRARKRGIHIITSAIEPATWQNGFSIAEEWDNVDISLGCNPVKFKYVDNAISLIKNNLQSIVAIGEVGLDYYSERNHTHRERQEEGFRKHIETAKELKVPIQVHSRSAGKAALQVLYSTDIEHVHMHAFDGKVSLARIASKEHGFYFSIPTSVVRSPQKKKLVRAIDIERLLFETDSPVLGPNREERNEPANVPIVMEEVAGILQRDEEEIRETVLENTLRLYSRIKIR